MRGSNGIVLIVIGLLVLWLAISGKYQCATLAFNCLVADDDAEETLTPLPKTTPPKPSGASGVKVLPPLLQLPTIVM